MVLAVPLGICENFGYDRRVYGYRADETAAKPWEFRSKPLGSVCLSCGGWCLDEFLAGYLHLFHDFIPLGRFFCIAKDMTHGMEFNERARE